MNILKLSFILSTFFLPLFAFSGQWSHSGKVLVTYAHTSHGGYGVFQLENMSTNPDNCTSPGYYVVSKANNPVFSEIYSLLLAAHMSGKKVQVWVSGCSPHNHMLIQHARVIN